MIREHFRRAQVTRAPAPFKEGGLAAWIAHIERDRAAKNISHAELCRVAPCQERTWAGIRTGRITAPQRETLQRLQRAVDELAPRAPAPVLAIAGLFHAAFRLIAIEQGLDPEAAARTDFTVQRPSDPAWLAANRCRQMAIYIVAVEHEISGVELGKIAGIAKKSASKALHTVENMRDTPAIDELLERVRAIVAPELRA